MGQLVASAFEDELEETIFGRLEITCHSVLRKHDVHDVLEASYKAIICCVPHRFVSSVFLVNDPSSRLWCQGIRPTMMSDRQSYSCSEVTANLWASVWNSRPRHSTGLTLRRAGYFSSRIGGTCCPWKRRIITTWMGTRRRLSQSSGTPGPLPNQALLLQTQFGAFGRSMDSAA